MNSGSRTRAGPRVLSFILDEGVTVMSQRINVRLADSRRGSQAFIAIVAVLVLVGAGIGGWWWWSTKEPTDKGPPPKTAADTAKNMVNSLEKSLEEIAKDPTKADEEIEDLKGMADTDVAGLKDQIAKAPAEVKAAAIAAITAALPKLKTLAEAAYKVPGVQAKLEPIVTKIMEGLTSIK